MLTELIHLIVTYTLTYSPNTTVAFLAIIGICSIGSAALNGVTSCIRLFAYVVTFCIYLPYLKFKEYLEAKKKEAEMKCRA